MVTPAYGIEPHLYQLTFVLLLSPEMPEISVKKRTSLLPSLDYDFPKIQILKVQSFIPARNKLVCSLFLCVLRYKENA